MISTRREALQLAVTCDDADYQAGLSRAIGRIPAFDRNATLGNDADVLTTAAAALAIGDDEFSGAVLERTRGSCLLLLAARHLLWTNDAHRFRSQLDRIAEALALTAPFAEINELVLACESAGAHGLAATARSLGSRGGDSLLNAEPESDAGRVLRFVHDVLGAAPDAPKGRLRLRLDVPRPIRVLQVVNLRLADATLIIDFQRNEQQTVIAVEQVAGAVPVRLILEPVLHARPTGARIDTQPAQLDLQAVGQRIVAPVQLMLDHRRELVLHH